MVDNISHIVSKMKEDQPHVWETDDFVDFLSQVGRANLINVSKNFSK